MLTSDAPAVLVLLYILAMVWFRTRLRYPRPAGARLRLTRAGVRYFLALALLLVVGWFCAPWLVQSLGLAALLSPTFARAAWFLAVYLGYIALHRQLMSRQVAVFSIQARRADWP